MACGCSKSSGPATINLSKALTCHMCHYAAHGASAMNDGAVSCTIDGKPVAGRETCPRGKWRTNWAEGLPPLAANSHTECKSLGVWWYGAPAWQRLVVWALKRTHPKYGVFGGCGCVKPLRDWWERVKG